MGLAVSTVLLLLAFWGVPLFVVIGMATLYSLHFIANVDTSAMMGEIYRLTSTPAFVAIPLFIYAGYVMAESKCADRIIRLSKALIGWMPGGLAIVCIIACAVMTALTGASGITIIALGGILLPALMKEKYPEMFSLGLITSSGSLGLLFPPSLPLILYGVVSNTNVEELFIAGIVPGIVRVLMVVLYSFWKGMKLKVKKVPFSRKEAWAAIKEASWEIPLPIVIFVGIYGGFFTAAEAAAVAAFYVTIVEVFIYKDIPLKKLPKVMLESIVVKGGVIIILGVAMGLTNYLIDQQVPLQTLDILQTTISNKYVFLLLLNVFLIVVGFLMDIFSAIVVVVPLIVPIATNFGIDPVHLGIIFVTNLEIGYIHPPVGINIILASYRFKKPVMRVFLSTLPYLVLMLITLLIITYVPEIMIRIHTPQIVLSY